MSGANKVKKITMLTTLYKCVIIKTSKENVCIEGEQ